MDAAVDSLAIARAIHVLAVVVWVGGVAMVTTVILPMVRRTPTEARTLLKAVERRFVWQARVATLLVAASGFYMVDRLDLWDRFRAIEFWWMHAMVLVWFIFTLILFVAQPLLARRRRRNRTPSKPEVNFARTQTVHWILLILSALTVLAAVAGSRGMVLVP